MSSNSKSENIVHLIKKKLPKNTWLLDLKSKNLKTLNSYNSICKDLEYVKNCISEIEKIISVKKTNNILLKSLTFSSVITYIRCFNSSKNQGRFKLNISTLKKYFPNNEKTYTDGMLKFHQFLFDLRNKFIAHADLNIFEKEMAFVEFNYDYENNELDCNFKTISASMFCFDKTQLNNFKVLTSYALVVIEIEIKKATSKLQDEIGHEKLKTIGLNTLKIK